MSNQLSLAPAISGEAGFIRYLQEIRKFPSLEADEEYNLAKKFIDHEDIKAAHKLVTSHLKLVAKIALGFKGYGLPLIELVSEGNIGLMQAVKKFKPELGFRLSTYAVWWIKAYIQEYILKSWSQVKLGTTAAQKTLFFNLGKIKKKLLNVESRNLDKNDIHTIALALNVSGKDVEEMNNRMNRDVSLNSPKSKESNEELVDFIVSPYNHEDTLASSQDFNRKRQLVKAAMNSALDERQRDIIVQRMLKEEPATLEDLSQKYGVSRERIRQIEMKALEKLQQAVQANDSESSSYNSANG
ncbi:MAG: RNA polymerase sigma factor RpoH [Alphaproteobacteria bacterium]